MGDCNLLSCRIKHSTPVDLQTSAINQEFISGETSFTNT